MTDETAGRFGEAVKGKIGVLIEEHFDPTEFTRFNEYLPTRGYQVEYISHLWGQEKLKFGSNAENDEVGQHVTVVTELNNIKVEDYNNLWITGHSLGAAVATLAVIDIVKNRIHKGVKMYNFA